MRADTVPSVFVHRSHIAAKPTDCRQVMPSIYISTGRNIREDVRTAVVALRLFVVVSTNIKKIHRNSETARLATKRRAMGPPPGSFLNFMLRS